MLCFISISVHENSFEVGTLIAIIMTTLREVSHFPRAHSHKGGNSTDYQNCRHHLCWPREHFVHIILITLTGFPLPFFLNDETRVCLSSWHNHCYSPPLPYMPFPSLHCVLSFPFPLRGPICLSGTGLWLRFTSLIYYNAELAGTQEPAFYNTSHKILILMLHRSYLGRH